MKVTISTSGLFKKGEFSAWKRALWQAERAKVAEGMQDAVKPLVAEVRANIGRAFKLSGAKLPRSVRGKVYASKYDRLPALYIGSKVPWLGIHEEGGTVRGPLLIPLNQPRRIGRKAFRRIVDDLMRAGNAYFKKVNGKTLLFAENIKDNSRSLSRFRKSFRASTGAKRVKRGTELPIAVLVPSVRILPRLGMERTIRNHLDRIVMSVERRLRQL